jgi:hypothetical protein
MERGTILWGVAGLLAGFFLAKTFASAEQFAKSVATDTASAGAARRRVQALW